ncbi:hypothetical protein K490DRAFT_52840 [Saccharata proteae CBS 121410]|uniref:DNA repair protein Crb2 Tudor domain-containing protein n=1 Tax=Saccharata proteae CBS 121410 TaxID=1314787 RepID=A0A9P4I2S0_9PEZI|nr:hypothetical protein K490DRAFT_52840 [Saccharata proteae CBS 121410]
MNSDETRQDLLNFEAQLAEVTAQLEHDPGNAELLDYKSTVQDGIEMCRTLLADVAAAEPQQPPAPAQQPKWSKENHPAYNKRGQSASATPVEEPVAHTFKVNEAVLAQWVSGDRGFHPATITSITGSSADPVFNVKFNGYNDTETLRSRNLRPMDSRKRKADDSPIKPATPIISTSNTPTYHGNVISAAANINQELADAAKKEPSKVSDGPQKPAKIARKVKAKKELEASKNKWQDFASKSKGIKGMKKESMFRVPDNVNGKVGFVGSGQGMRKDEKRMKIRKGSDPLGHEDD